MTPVNTPAAGFKIRLFPGEWRTFDVGRLDVGALFWIDVQLHAEGRDTREFVATYVFDDDGYLIWNEILDCGLRSDPNRLDVGSVVAEQRAKLGPFQPTDIRVRPLSIVAHGVTCGLVIRGPDEDDGVIDDEAFEPVVDAYPGLTLMFYPPWEEGGYDT